MYKKCKLVMLPTNEKASIIGLYEDTENLIFNNPNNKDIQRGQPHHLYILSDEEIKESDWCINKIDYLNKRGKIIQITPDLIESANNHKDVIKKIIATTAKLNIHPNIADSYRSANCLPQIPQSFIETYVEKYNNCNLITEVMVKYETEEYCLPMPNIHVKQYRNVLKINPDNTINIKPIKDN